MPRARRRAGPQVRRSAGRLPLDCSVFVHGDWAPQLLAGDARATAERFCQRLAVGSGVEETRIWEWGFLERVSTGLYVLDFGAVDLSRRFLRTAELLV